MRLGTVNHLVVTLGLVLALTLALLPLEFSVGRYIYDDMFYYLRIAENLAAGRGSTFDGVSPTNGYHPLWMLLCVLLVLAVPGDELVHGLLVVAAVIHAAEGAVLAGLLGRFARPWLATALTALYLLNWRTLAVNLCGLESGLATLAALLMARRLTGPPASDPRAAALTGLLAGLAVLARFDLLLLAAFAAIWILVDRRPGAARTADRRLALAAVMGASALVPLLPWFAFSLDVSGTLLPNSRIAVAILNDIRYDIGDPAQMLELLHRQIWSFLWWSSDIANFLGLFPGLAPNGRGMFVAGTLVAGTGLCLLAVLAARRREVAAARLGLALLAYAILHAGYYAVFHRVELRYVLPALAMLFVSIGIAIETGLARARSPERAGTVAALALGTAFLCATGTGIAAFARGHGSTRAHLHHYVARDMGRWLASAPPGIVAGAWNAGTLSWFAGPGLVDLDGVVNDDALRAIRAGRVWDYILARGITHLVEEPEQLESNLDRFAGVTDWRLRLGPPVHVAEDAEGRRIVARPVLRDAQPTP